MNHMLFVKFNTCASNQQWLNEGLVEEITFYITCILQEICCCILIQHYLAQLKYVSCRCYSMVDCIRVVRTRSQTRCNEHFRPGQLVRQLFGWLLLPIFTGLTILFLNDLIHVYFITTDIGARQANYQLILCSLNRSGSGSS